MSIHNLKHEFKVVLQGMEGKKFEKAVRRIADECLKGSDEAVTNAVEETLVALETAYWRNPTIRPFTTKILHAFAQRIMDERRMPVLAEILERSSQCNAIDLFMKQGQFSQEETRAAACQWMIIETFRYVGVSIDRSLQYALALSDGFHRIMQGFQDSGMVDSPEMADGSVGHKLRALTTLLWTSTVSVSTEDSPAKAWLERIIEHASSNPTASDTMYSILRLLEMGRREGGVEVRLQEDESTHAAYAYSDEMAQQLITESRGGVLILKLKHAELLGAWHTEDAKKGTLEKREGDEVLNWFRDNRTQIETTVERKLSAISEAPKRWLRPDGLDHIEIRVATLRNAGVRAVIFRAEDMTFPNVGIELLVKKETLNLIRFKTTLETLDGLDQDAFFNLMHDDSDLLHALFTAVIVDILHRIIVGDHELRMKKRWQKTGGKEGDGIEGIGKTIRPYIRRLPLGQKASETAQTNARETLRLRLPPGVTFVSAFYRNGRLHYDLPTEPVAIYGDSDLLDLLEQP